MPVCQCCGQQWSWAETMKSYLAFSKGMKCPYCAAIQYETTASKQKTIPLSILPGLSIILAGSIFNLSLFFVTGICVAFILLLSAIVPFLLQLSNEQEPLW